MIKEVAKNEHSARNVLREIYLLRKLSEIENNIFTSKLLDIITSPGEGPNEDLSQVFLVMELSHTDMRSFIISDSRFDLDDNHIRVILYNCLCALKFIHSGSIIHRDLKPGNILLNSDASV